MSVEVENEDSTKPVKPAIHSSSLRDCLWVLDKLHESKLMDDAEFTLNMRRMLKHWHRLIKTLK